jgi:chorismate synthase
MPSGLDVDAAFINAQLARRQGGYGRGGRQRIESDEVIFLAGVRHGMTTGAPIVLQVINRDDRLNDSEATPAVYRPRPGHADLSGSIKHLTTDCRNALERASARETAARVAVGALARLLLRELGIETFGCVASLLDVDGSFTVDPSDLDAVRAARNESDVYCPDAAASAEMIDRIRQAKIDKDTVGGTCVVHVTGCPIGIGSGSVRSANLDAKLAGAVVGIQAFKAVEIGLGRECGRRTGSHVHDPIHFDKSRREEPSLGYHRPSNNAGGIEGGMTNGMPVVVTGTMKPISTLLQGMESIDLNTHEPHRSDYERSDVCALPAASVVMEHVVAMEIAAAVIDKYGGDSVTELLAHFNASQELARSLPLDKTHASSSSDADQTEA